MQALKRVANLSYSLLYDVDNNSVESFNSVVNKFVGGKRINYSLKGSYHGRCFAAAINFNNKKTFVLKIIEKMTHCVGIYTQQFSEVSLKNSQKQGATNKKNKIHIHSADSDYGACHSGSNTISDMSTEAYEKVKMEFLQELAASDITKIPIVTMGQRNNNEWEKQRSNRLTASNFGRIIRMKTTTDTANAVKNIFCRVGCSKFKKLPDSLQWGIDNEENAKNKFEKVTGLRVDSCGFFVDKEKSFLGASPDGLIGLDSIVEIKCPFSARNTDIKTAIEQKLIKYLELDPNDNNKIFLKEKDNYMYQVQGQLHITNRQKCYFIVYTEYDIKYCIIEKNSANYWYSKMIDPLEKFYLNAMFPEIIDSRNSRNLPMRSILKKDL